MMQWSAGARRGLGLESLACSFQCLGFTPGSLMQSNAGARGGESSS